MDFHSRKSVGLAQVEVNARVIGGEIAASAEDIASLASGAAGQIHGRSYGVARAAGTSYKLKLYPVIPVRIDVAQEGGGTVDVVDDDINFAVIEKVAESGSATHANFGQSCAFDGGDEFEFAVLKVVKKEWTLSIGCSPFGVLVYAGVNVAIDDEQVLPSIVVEV